MADGVLSIKDLLNRKPFGRDWQRFRYVKEICLVSIFLKSG